MTTSRLASSQPCPHLACQPLYRPDVKLQSSDEVPSTPHTIHIPGSLTFRQHMTLSVQPPGKLGAFTAEPVMEVLSLKHVGRLVSPSERIVIPVNCHGRHASGVTDERQVDNGDIHLSCDEAQPAPPSRLLSPVEVQPSLNPTHAKLKAAPMKQPAAPTTRRPPPTKRTRQRTERTKKPTPHTDAPPKYASKHKPPTAEPQKYESGAEISEQLLIAEVERRLKSKY